MCIVWYTIYLCRLLSPLYLSLRSPLTDHNITSCSLKQCTHIQRILRFFHFIIVFEAIQHPFERLCGKERTKTKQRANEKERIHSLVENLGVEASFVFKSIRRCDAYIVYLFFFHIMHSSTKPYCDFLTDSICPCPIYTSINMVYCLVAS